MHITNENYNVTVFEGYVPKEQIVFMCHTHADEEEYISNLGHSNDTYQKHRLS